MTFGHIITTTCLHQALDRWNFQFPYVPFLLGTFFPDLIDKPIALLTILPDRAIFHSVFVLGILFLVLVVTLPQNRMLVYTFSAGTLLHLIQDIPVKPEYILWPFGGPLETLEFPLLSEGLWTYYIGISRPVPWTIEMICLPWFIIIFISYVRWQCRSFLTASIPKPVHQKIPKDRIV